MKAQWKQTMIGGVFRETTDFLRKNSKRIAARAGREGYFGQECVPLLAYHLGRLRVEIATRPASNHSAYYLYDHRSNDGTLRIYPRLLRAFYRHWSRTGMTAEMASTVARLFMIHEAYHILQRVDSEHYPMFQGSNSTFVPVDYRADAMAIDALFALSTRKGSWAGALARVVEANILGSQAFSLTEDTVVKETSFSPWRLRRQLVWGLQYARMHAFDEWCSFGDYELGRFLDVELLDVNGRNLYDLTAVRPADLQKLNRLIVYRGPYKGANDDVAVLFAPLQQNDALVAGVFDNDLQALVDYFRPLWAQQPRLRGGARSHAKKTILRLLIVKNSSAQYVEQVYAGFIRELSTNSELAALGFFSKWDVVVGSPKAADEQQNREQIEAALQNDKRRDEIVLVTIGTEVSIAAQRHFDAHRILFAGVSDPLRAGLAEAGGRSRLRLRGRGKIAGVAYSMPAVETVKTLRETIRGARLGYVFSAGQYQQDDHLRAEIEESRLDVELIDIGNPSALAPATRQANVFFGRYFLCSRMEEFAALHGPGVAFVGVSAFNVASGAMMAIGIETTEIGRLLVTEVLIPHLRDGTALGEIPVHFPVNRRLLVSRGKLSQCNLSLRDNVLRRGTVEFVE